MKLDISRILKPWSLSSTVIVVGETVSTLAKAIQVANRSTQGLGGGALILLPPGDYSNETLPVINLDDRLVKIEGMAGLGTAVVGALVTSGTSGNLALESLVIASIDNDAAAVLYDTTVSGAITGNSAIGMHDSRVVGAIACRQLTAWDSEFAGNITCLVGDVLMYNCADTSTGALVTTSGVLVRLVSTTVPAAVISIVFSGAAGVLQLDAMSNFFWEAATETLTNGSKSIMQDIT